MKSKWIKHRLIFKVPAGTSRGVLHSKDTWYLILEDEGFMSIGEAGMFRGLSYDDVPQYEQVLDALCNDINTGCEISPSQYAEYPSIRFALEVAMGSLDAKKQGKVFLDNPWTRGQDSIPVNGLIWMGDKDSMRSQIRAKLDSGYHCIKMKIGAIDFDTEMELIRAVRSVYSKDELCIRVDANGAFSVGDAMEKLKRLSELDIHSIEQPIKAGQWEEMEALCRNTPVDIALDEELIGCHDADALLDAICPQYIILKPTLVGGIEASDMWIHRAKERGIGYWITSALESNVGLDAIARYCYPIHCGIEQGLGTGMLYTNNIPYPFHIEKGRFYLKGSRPTTQEIIKTLSN